MLSGLPSFPLAQWQPPFRPILPSALGWLPPQARFRPRLASDPCSLPPQPRFRPSLASAPGSLSPHAPFRPASGSLPPHTPVRPILPSAPASLPPQPSVRPSLASAPASRPPHAPFRPSLPSASGRPWMLIGRSRVRRRGASELIGIDVWMRCPNTWRLTGSSAAELCARGCAACSARTFAFDGTQRTVSSKNYG